MKITSSQTNLLCNNVYMMREFQCHLMPIDFVSSVVRSSLLIERNRSLDCRCIAALVTYHLTRNVSHFFHKSVDFYQFGLEVRAIMRN